MVEDLLPRRGGVSAVELAPGDAYLAEVNSTVDIPLGYSAQVFNRMHLVCREETWIAFENLLFDGVMNDYFPFEFRVLVEEVFLVIVAGCAADRGFFAGSSLPSGNHAGYLMASPRSPPHPAPKPITGSAATAMLTGTLPPSAASSTA
ncbi:hypothetical protein ACH5A3_43160 [Streptomyces echinatus]|uniref:hypothetical protein n=1 Tax=Streptomyces echinatus TaxID=67293 RepID=UPI0037AA2C16